MALLRRASSTPLDGVDAVLADLDGVVYAGHQAIPHAVEALNAAGQTRRLGYITNNASRTDATVATQLTELGLHVRPEDVITSPQAAMRLLRDMLPEGSRVLVVGGEGLTVEVEKAGFTVTRSAKDSPAAVVQGFSPDVAWRDLAEAAFALALPEDQGGIPWVATNTDWTILAAPAGSRPDFILGDLRELSQPYPAAKTRGKDGAVTVGDATVRVAGNDVEIVAEGSAQINLLRAAAGAIWDSGRAIYGLRVPERLYDDPFRTAR